MSTVDDLTTEEIDELLALIGKQLDETYGGPGEPNDVSPPPLRSHEARRHAAREGAAVTTFDPPRKVTAHHATSGATMQLEILTWDDRAFRACPPMQGALEFSPTNGEGLGRLRGLWYLDAATVRELRDDPAYVLAPASTQRRRATRPKPADPRQGGFGL